MRSRDMNEAVALYSKAADKGSLCAAHELGYLMYYGTLFPTTPQDKQKGIDLLEQSAAGGYHIAMFDVANILETTNVYFLGERAIAPTLMMTRL